MKAVAVLKEKLTSIDGKGYGAYKEVAGEYDYGWYQLCIDHVQGDPFAAPSKLRVVIGQKTAGFPPCLFNTREKKTAAEDYLIRQFRIAGDGREFVITDETAVKIRAEDGRSIRDTDISLFIDHLPNRKNTKKFCTENASGSTSQAANIIEAIEAGS